MDDIFEVPEQKKSDSEENDKKTDVSITTQTVRDIPIELNIMGLTFDEAQPEVDKYIDRAILLDYSRIRILHGKGTGRLRKKIWKHLKDDLGLSNLYLAPQTEGGSGVTIIEL